MITLNACPRCSGAILDFGSPNVDGPLCITCGWRRPDVPLDVQLEVEAHVGLESTARYLRKRIGTGKPPLSGWEAKKRQRERIANEARPLAYG